MNRQTEADEAGEFECPRCESRMVRYRITKLWVHAECGRPGCFQVSYRRKREWLSFCQLRLLRAVNNGCEIRVERGLYRHGRQARKVVFSCLGWGIYNGPTRTTLGILVRKGFLVKLPEIVGEVGYKLNREKCEEYRVFDLTKEGGDR